MPYKTESEAIAQRLLNHTPLSDLVATRITPNFPQQEPDGDYLVFFRTGGGGNTNFDGRCGLQEFMYQLEAYAASDEVAEKILSAAVERLCGNQRKGILPWVDRDNGVQGCFNNADASNDIRADGTMVLGQTVTIFFCPQ